MTRREEKDAIMIYYFSGTGNSKWVADQLASKTDDMAVNIIKCPTVPSKDKQTVGLVFPIHAWGVPEPVLTFVKRLVGEPMFTFAVCTCGDEAGNAMEKLSDLFPLDSAYSVAMPNSYIMLADVDSDEIITSKIIKAKEKLDTIADQIIAKQSVYDVHKGSLSWIKSSLVNFGFNKVSRRTKPFYVTDKCTSCGFCAEICPANTIKMVDGKPHWGKPCYQCTACINRCPAKAIEYGKGTRAKGRYQFHDVEGIKT